MAFDPASAVVPWPASDSTLEVPAHRDFVASIRALTRSAAVLGDLALEDAQELQMAVDEAATLLLPLVDPEGDQRFRVAFDMAPSELRITLSAHCRPGAAVDRTGLPWAMLSALDPGVEVTTEAGSGNGSGSDIAIAIHRRSPATLRD